jgi:hypothetical protein
MGNRRAAAPVAGVQVALDGQLDQHRVGGGLQPGPIDGQHEAVGGGGEGHRGGVHGIVGGGLTQLDAVAQGVDQVDAIISDEDIEVGVEGQHQPQVVPGGQAGGRIVQQVGEVQLGLVGGGDLVHVRAVMAEQLVIEHLPFTRRGGGLFGRSQAQGAQVEQQVSLAGRFTGIHAHEADSVLIDVGAVGRLLDDIGVLDQGRSVQRVTGPDKAEQSTYSPVLTSQR